MDVVDDESLVRHAYQEQKLSNLSWFNCTDKLANSTLANTFGPGHRVNSTPRPSQIRKNLTNWFIETWELNRATNRKLSFYNNIKSSFGVKLYLTLKLNNIESKRIAQLRTSSHQFKVETGRYQINRQDPTARACPHCSSDDISSLGLLLELPFSEPIIEDEPHVLSTCPLYHEHRE